MHKKASAEVARLKKNDPTFRDRLRERRVHYSEAEIVRDMYGKFAVTTECMEINFFGFMQGGKNKICRDSLQAWIDKKDRKCDKIGPSAAQQSFRATAERAIPHKMKMLRNLYYVPPVPDEVRTIHVLPPGHTGQFFDTQDEPKELVVVLKILTALVVVKEMDARE